MRVLLDTHVGLWAITDSPRLSVVARRLILAPGNQINVSAASIWEIAIKHGLGKQGMPISGNEAMKWFTKAGYDFLPAQALAEPMRLMTHDALVAKYSDTTILI